MDYVYGPGRNHLFVPGPVNIPEAVLRSMNRNNEDYRSPAVPAMTKTLLEDVKKIFKTTTGTPFLIPTTGTGAWESALTNTLSPGDRTVSFLIGQFSLLWIDQQQRLKFNVDVVESEWGQGANLDILESKIAEDTAHTIKAICIVHNETATGVTNNLAKVRKILDNYRHPALFLVDGVSSICAIDFRMDEWGVDVALTGSQKALSLPTGIGIVCASPKALEASKTAKSVRVFFDWNDYLKFYKLGTYWPYTPSIQLLYGLRTALDLLFEEGLDNVIARHSRLGKATRLAVEAWGLKNCTQREEWVSDTVTAVLVPPHIDSTEIVKRAWKRYNLSLGLGLNKVAGKVFRIGHLGNLNELQLLGCLAGVEMVLRDVGYPVKLGSGRAMATLSHVLSLSLLLFSLAHGLNNNNPQCSETKEQGSTLQIFHVYSPCSPFRPSKPMSWEESVLQMQAKDQARLQFLSSLVATKPVVPIASGRQIIQSPTYIVKAKIGTPPQTLLMAVDTSSDAAWIPCNGCVGCSSNVFNSVKSTTYKNLGCQAAQCKQVPNPTCLGSSCSFNMTYGGSSIAANLSQETFTLATDSIPGYTFGCIQKTSGSSVPPQGLLGLGRGPLSLLSQTQNLYQSTFSYCLPSFKSPNFSGSLRLGPAVQPKRIKYTPLLKNPRRSSLYYVNLNAIRVGRRTVDIPPAALAFNPITGSGTIFDSGTVFTRLVQPVYLAVRNEFRRRVGPKIPVTTLGGFDTCYSVPFVVPRITFMFSGLNMTLPEDNIVIHSTAGSITCLAMAAAPDNVNSVLNVIANMQQQNHRVLIDVPNSRLGVAREACT